MEKHDLKHEFAEKSELIHKLKTEDNHFRKLFDGYHDVDKDIHRIETSGVYTDDELNLLRSKRVQLKDQLYEIIKNSEQ